MTTNPPARIERNDPRLKYALVKTLRALVIMHDGAHVVYSAVRKQKAPTPAAIKKLADEKKPIPTEKDLAAHWALVGSVERARKLMGTDFNEEDTHLAQLNSAFC